MLGCVLRSLFIHDPITYELNLILTTLGSLELPLPTNFVASSLVLLTCVVFAVDLHDHLRLALRKVHIIDEYGFLDAA